MVTARKSLVTMSLAFGSNFIQENYRVNQVPTVTQFADQLCMLYVFAFVKNVTNNLGGKNCAYVSYLPRQQMSGLASLRWEWCKR